MSIPVLNLKSLAPHKIRTLLLDFQSQESQYQPQLIVLSKNKPIYRKRVKQSDLSRNSNCQRLVNSEQKIIDLKDYQIDCSGEPSNQYIKHLFDKITIFLTSGYLELEQKYLMDILYVMIVLDLNKTWMDRLAATVSKRYYTKLWDVLLLIYNNNLQRYFDHAMKLMENNDEFLIDQENQALIASKFLQLKSIKSVEQFLANLCFVLTFRGTEEVGAKCFNLIDVMYRYYLHEKGDTKSYSSQKVLALLGDNIGAEVLFKMQDVGVNQLVSIVKKKQQQRVLSKLKIDSQKQQLKHQIQTLKKQIAQGEKKQTRMTSELQKLQRITKLEGANLAPSIPAEITHHPQIQDCECAQSVTLKCGHKNCLSCAFMDIQRFNIKPNRQIEEYNIRCLKGKDPQDPCKEIWDSARYDTLGQLLNAFMN